ncbi:NRAMP family divalent metal transporter [Neolewinella agarilytica]|uniref:Mn2+ and Fe2+ transporters of the NRAMP family n=1 Tax=Neolewinella agarilytica TaxID=478744 RepID=A0A1H9EXZ9_9BACT|nr:divalent metal cation transporter [Neolewinella agarilytica]SEQ30525.1 Mn2+ and Fe2+ transporters of the NRAMP family [Neolewinella agarilytica]
MSKSSFSRAIVWSLIAAAFIGPGTVTTAAKAGSQGGWYYLPYVLLAAVAGLLLMEMVARITLVSEQSLGGILGKGGKLLAYACFGAVVLGCMAYQAGNLLGALSGAQLLMPVHRLWVLLIGLLAVLILWKGDTRLIGKALSNIVVLMGIAFVIAAVFLLFSDRSLTGGGEVATATIIGLVGTTIVPYNFFLAAGLSKGQKLNEMRMGLAGSFIVGAIITMSIVLVASVAGSFTTFADLARTLDASLGKMSKGVLGFGLFAAGFSSAVTAPLAAGLAGRELLGREMGNTSTPFRIIWGGVLAVGLLVACLELDIIGVILAAQVANGFLLPFIAAIVLVFANDRELLKNNINAHWQNMAGLLVAGFLAAKNFDLLLGKLGVADSVWPQALAVVYLIGVGGLMYGRRGRKQR